MKEKEIEDRLAMYRMLSKEQDNLRCGFFFGYICLLCVYGSLFESSQNCSYVASCFPTCLFTHTGLSHCRTALCTIDSFHSLLVCTLVLSHISFTWFTRRLAAQELEQNREEYRTAALAARQHITQLEARIESMEERDKRRVGESLSSVNQSDSSACILGQSALSQSSSQSLCTVCVCYGHHI